MLLLPDGETWCLIADQFKEGKGYLPMTTKDLAGGEFQLVKPEQYDMEKNKKRHGGVLAITDNEYERLLFYFDRKNPVVEGLFANPDIAVFHNKYYIYPTTDGFSGWSGTEFFVFSSEDGKSFKREEKLIDVASEQVPWAVGNAWAPCITERGGMYFYYFCAKDSTGSSCIGVASAKSPIDPFTAEREPMLTMEHMKKYNIQMSQTIDPSIYVEGKDYYLLFGNGEPAIVKLSEDMVHSLPETMKNLEGLDGFREAVTVLKRNGLYHFTWSCEDTSSEEYHVSYGTAQSLDEPVVFDKVILQKDVRRGCLGTGHHSIVKLPGQEEYIIAYHRFGTPLDAYKEGKGWHREVCVAPLTFGKDEKIEKVIVL